MKKTIEVEVVGHASHGRTKVILPGGRHAVVPDGALVSSKPVTVEAAKVEPQPDPVVSAKRVYKKKEDA
jgi:hypothetical protein